MRRTNGDKRDWTPAERAARALRTKELEADTNLRYNKLPYRAHLGQRRSMGELLDMEARLVVRLEAVRAAVLAKREAEAVRALSAGRAAAVVSPPVDSSDLLGGLV